MKETVNFFGHPQIPSSGEFTKAVEVIKVNEVEGENIVIHPRFQEVSDRFVITCRYRVLGGDETMYDEGESDIEDMCKEVDRILSTVYDPSAGTGTFFRTNRQWRIQDKQDLSQPELKRILDFTLTQIKSDQDTVFRGFNGVLSFDDSASTADTKRGSDYTYTEAYDVVMDEGYRTSTRMTRLSSPNPTKFRTLLGGNIRVQMYAKKADLTDSNIDQLDNIYKAQNNGELATCVFLHAVQNTESTAATLTTTTTFMVINIRKDTRDEELVRYFVTGEITIPSTAAIT